MVLGYGGVIVLIGGLVGWSVMASVSGAVIAAGRVAVEARNQIVEHIDGGRVHEILVQEGQRVSKGQSLLRFSDDLLRTEEAILVNRLYELTASRNRLEAEFTGADHITWDLDLTSGVATDPVIQQIISGQERLFKARTAARIGEVAQIKERISQAENEITGLEAQLASQEGQLELVQQELESQRELHELGLTELSDLLELERHAKRLEGQSGSITALIAGIRSHVAEMEIQILQIDTRSIEDAEAQSREVSSSEIQFREQLASVREQLGRLEVVAPVAGTVFELNVLTPSEVVQPGEPILQIVPEGRGFVVIGQIDPIDVDQVYPGQKAVMRFSSFPARETPEFDGVVTRISADVVVDPNIGRAWYEVELVLDPSTADELSGDEIGLTSDAQDLSNGFTILPGMPVEVHIRTGERTVVSYLVKPVRDFFYRSLRED